MTFRLPMLMLAMALLFAGGSVRATLPTPDVALTFVGVTLTRSQQPALTVTYGLAASRPMRIRLRLFATPTEGQPRAAGLVADRVIAVDGTGRAAIAIPITGAGDIELSAIAEPAAGGESDGDIRYVRVGAAGAASVFTMAAYLPMHGREIAARRPGFGLQPARNPDGTPLRAGAPAWMLVGGGTATLRQTAAAGPWPLLRRAAATAWAQASNQLVVQGTISTVINGVTVPMRNTVLQVWDSDSLSPDDLLGTTQTNENGQYRVTVTNDDGIGGGGVDIYLYITSRQPLDQPVVGMDEYVSDGHGIEPATYVWQSPTTDNVPGPAADIDFQITENEPAAAVWSGASRAEWLAAAQHSAHVPTYVAILYPLEGAPFELRAKGTGFRRKENRILLPAKNNAPEVVGHEYGHAIMFQAYGTIPGPGGAHKLCTQASAGLAWSEGFATYYGMAAANDNGVFHTQIGDLGRSFENWSCNLQDMAVDEGAVAAALWDLWDTPTDNNGGNPDQGRDGYCDNNQGDGLVTINQLLGTLWISSQASVSAYWTNLLPQLNDAQKPPSAQIMNYNYYTFSIQRATQEPLDALSGSTAC